jgi:hypothetical protein
MYNNNPLHIGVSRGQYKKERKKERKKEDAYVMTGAPLSLLLVYKDIIRQYSKLSVI